LGAGINLILEVRNGRNFEYISACGNDPILNGVVKRTWGFPGWIMSDWKAVYGWEFALKGLDQQSGPQLDDKEWFGQPRLGPKYARPFRKPW